LRPVSTQKWALMTVIGSGQQTYEWIENWAQIPDSEGARSGWAHPGMAITEANQIITCHPGEPTLLVFDRDGHLLRSITTNLVEGHGLTFVMEGDTPYLWVADPGSKRRKRAAYQPEQGGPGGQVVKMTLAGQSVLALERPCLEIYREGKYSPTAVAVNEKRHGGNGDVWVSDGYGRSQVHRYSAEGEYRGSLNGLEGAAGAFSCPHGVWIDTRKPEPELYIADRSNHRIQVYDAEGQFKRAFGADFLVSPSAFAGQGERLIVAELHARLTVLDAEDRLVCYLGRNDAVCRSDGWPNMRDPQGVPTRTTRLEIGKFNSPHGIAVDCDGNIYVAEWLIGGRTIKLAKAS
jgi:DNA-binding beta-propeller fold protein YncE